MRQLSFLDKFPKRKPPLPYNILKIQKIKKKLIKVSIA